MYHIIWPDECNVSDSVIKSWFTDAIANGEITPDEDFPNPDINLMAVMLHQAGLITLAADQEIPGWMDANVEEDVRSRFEREPVSLHHPDCGCNRCYYGDDAVIWMYHPAEY